MTQLNLQADWQVFTFSKVLTDDSIEIITPSGFTFELTGKFEITDFIIGVLYGGEYGCPDGTRLLIRGGSVKLIDTDSWKNPSVELHGDICSQRELALVAAQSLMRYL